MNVHLFPADSAEKESPPERAGTQKGRLIKRNVTDKVATDGDFANPGVSYRGAVHAPKLRLGTPRQFIDRDVQWFLRALLGGAT
jgi:hypothetical protein